MSRTIPLLAALAFMNCAIATGEPYTFTKVADTSGEFSALSPFVTINDLGIVAFTARRTDGETGVFTGFGGPLTTIASTSGLFSSINLDTPSINNQNQVAFVGSSIAHGFGVHRSDGVMTTPIAVISGPFERFDGQFVLGPGINDVGAVGFWGKLDSSTEAGIFVGDGTTTTTIVTNLGPPYSIFSDLVAINNGGQVAAYAIFDAIGASIIRGASGAPPTTIADSNGTFSLFAPGADISDSGKVVFAGRLDNGLDGVFVGDGTSASVFADDTGPFSKFSVPAINDLDQVAFRAILDAGGVGIFVGPDPIADKVIQSGDPLFGSTVTTLTTVSGLSLVRGGFNNSRQLAFTYTLANGVNGIAIATVVPEPSTLALAAFGFAGLVSWAWRLRKA